MVEIFNVYYYFSEQKSYFEISKVYDGMIMCSENQNLWKRLNSLGMSIIITRKLKINSDNNKFL